MSRIVMACLVVVACGVSASAARRESTTMLAPDAAFSRAMVVVARFDYAVVDADRAAGFLRAERKASSLGIEALVGASYIWALTITILPDSIGVRYVFQPQNIKEERGRRTTTGMRITSAQQAEVDSIVALLTER